MERGTEWLLMRAASIGTHAKQWAQEVIRTAILDRFMHHAELINITGKSYRLRNRDTKLPQEESKKRRGRRSKDEGDKL